MLGLMNNNGTCCFVALCRKLISFIVPLIDEIFPLQNMLEADAEMSTMMTNFYAFS